MPLITVPGENDPDVEVHYENVGAGKPVFASAIAPYLWKPGYTPDGGADIALAQAPYPRGERSPCDRRNDEHLRRYGLAIIVLFWVLKIQEREELYCY